MVPPGIQLVPGASAFREKFPKLNFQVSLIGGGESQVQSDKETSQNGLLGVALSLLPVPTAQLGIFCFGEGESFCKFSVDTILYFKLSLSRR